MAHCAQWRGETVIAIHNFSRATRTVKLKELDGAQGLTHVFGRDVHEPLAATSSVIDLDGYDYRWLRAHHLNA
jgi:maltose alpha-D-glucosyltransferase/alpha-amylase